MPQHAYNRFYDLPVELQELILRRRYAWIVLGRLLEPPLRRWRQFIQLRLKARQCYLTLHPNFDIRRRIQERFEIRRRDIAMMLESDFYSLPGSRCSLPISKNIHPCRSQYSYSKDEWFGSPNASRQELHRAMFGSDLPSRRNRRERRGKK
jgi:hypothetical protein